MYLLLQLFSIAAATVFLLLLPFRLLKLRTETIKIVAKHRGYAKLVCTIARFSCAMVDL